MNTSQAISNITCKFYFQLYWMLAHLQLIASSKKIVNSMVSHLFITKLWMPWLLAEKENVLPNVQYPVLDPLEQNFVNSTSMIVVQNPAS